MLAGKVEMIEPQLSGEFATLIGWADKVRKLGVRANADTPTDAKAAVRFGAEGIGLCRTEHMFFDEDRIQAVREMILADDEKTRRAAIAKLLPMQRADFVELFVIMANLTMDSNRGLTWARPQAATCASSALLRSSIAVSSGRMKAKYFCICPLGSRELYSYRMSLVVCPVTYR